MTQQDLYDANVIQKLEIHFDQTNWDALLDAQKNGAEDYIVAAWCKVNGIKYDSVGVKYKGNSSYNSSNKKNPMHIELDYVKKQKYNGQGDIKLSNGFQDPTFIREALSYYILENYMDAPRANFMNVYINDQLVGLYTNVESINSVFIDNTFGTKDNTLVKCNPQSVMGSLPTLLYLGADSTKYYAAYEIKSDFGWKELIHLCDTLNNKVASIEKILDVDKALWMLAFNIVLVNLDSYTGNFSQNYYLYRDQNERFASIVWDLNMSFGGFPGLGGGSTDQSKLSTLYNATSTNRPLISKLLANASYKKKYMAHIRTISKDFFENNLYLDEAQRLRTLIDADVKADPNKFYTYAQFQSSMTTDITNSGGGPGGSVPGLSKLMTNRVAFFKTDAEYNKVPPSIKEYYTEYAGAAGMRIHLKLETTGSSYLGYRYGKYEKFTYVQMYDDGLHGDGAANDLHFTYVIPQGDFEAQYYLYVENNDAGLFSPQNAEHNYYTVKFLANDTDIKKGQVVINEYMAVNKSTVQSKSGKYEDWIELYNNTDSDIDLTGAYLSDNEDKPYKWNFPLNTTIKAKSYLIVWADEDGKADDGDLHASFKLSASGESLILSNSDSTLIEKSTFGVQSEDVSMSRCSNGTGDFFATATSTYGKSNACATATADASSKASFTIVPNPSNGYFEIKGDLVIQRVDIYNLQGRLVHTEYDNSIETQLSSGLYVVRINNGTASLKCQIIIGE